MEKRQARLLMAPCARAPRFRLGLPILFLLVLTGCGAPGDPVPPRRAIPVPISDLAARQLGGSFILTFSLPRKTVDDEAITQTPAIEIYRGFVPPGIPPQKVVTRMVYSIPGPSVNTYLHGPQIEFIDAIGLDELRAHAEQQLLYVVRTRVTAKKASADSNSVTVRLFPVAEPINDLRGVVTEPAIELSWSAPTFSNLGGTPPKITGYRVYRAEVDDVTAVPQDAANIKLKAPLALLEFAPKPGYRDTQIQFGRTYLYSVRSVSSSDSSEVESADSSPVIITPRDIFPPAPPKNLVALFVPLVANRPAHVELSWGISPETDLAGYHVYRSEQEDGRERLTREALVAPTFRDMSSASGHRYVYYVTAIDRAGNESATSEPVAIEIPRQAP